MPLKSVKILYTDEIYLIFQNIYTTQSFKPLLFTQLLLFKYADVILTETIMVRILFLRRAYDDQRNAGSP